jgi:hypothetical protein
MLGPSRSPNGYPGYPPSIPPSYTTHADHFPQQQYPSQQSLASNPYEYASVTRQGTQSESRSWFLAASSYKESSQRRPLRRELQIKAW